MPLSLRGQEEVFRILRFSNQGAKVHLELWVSVEGEEYSFLRKGARATEGFYLCAGTEEVVRVEGEEFLCELKELSTRRTLVGTLNCSGGGSLRCRAWYLPAWLVRCHDLVPCPPRP